MWVQLEESQDQWARLEALVVRAERHGIGALRGEEVLELGGLYRRAAARLSFTRTRPLGTAQRERLNALVGRAYGQLYRTPRKPGLSLRQFVAAEFPAAVRLNWRFLAAALLVALLGAFSGAVLSRQDDAVNALFGPGAETELRQVAQRHAGAGPENWLPDEARPMASTLIITNNLKVSATALALGITGGIGTALVLWYNGLMLGVVGVLVHRAGADTDFWAFVAPHGVLELPAVFVAGAAGLMIGYALLFPGRLYRLDALKLAGRQAIKLLMGAGLMLLVAGVIEGLFSPVPEIPHALKFALAATLFACLCGYLASAGRGAEQGRNTEGPATVSPITQWMEAGDRDRAQALHGARRAAVAD